jgi:general secretion pathway protein I
MNRRNRGFTLLEVMFGLALLGLGLTVLIKSAASNIFNAQQAHLMGVVSDLARGKMYDIEDKLIKDGFSDTEQHEEDQTFDEEGWPAIHYSYKIELVELPNFDSLQAIMQGSGSAGSGASGDKAGSGDGAAGPAGAFGDSMLGGMLSQFGGLGGGSRGGAGGKAGGDINASIGSSFIQSQYSMFQEILKVTIRKVTLTVNWQVMGHDRDMKVVQFLTDAGSMDKVLQGIGSKDLDTGSGSGSGSGGTGGGRGSGSSGGTGGGGTGGGRGTPTAGTGGRGG